MPGRATPDPLMLQETRQVPAALARQWQENAPLISPLVRAIRERQPAYAVTVARGSSDHACTFLKYALETQLCLPVVSAAPSVLTLYGTRLRLAGALVVAVSQSGASPDITETLRAAREAGALTVALVNVQDSELAATAEFVLPLRCGEEQAVAATKSFIASLTAFLPVLAELGGDHALTAALEALPTDLRRTLELEEQAAALARRYRFADQLLILGRGLNYGVAQEAALKLKETSGVHAEAYSAAEFSHGPRRLIVSGLPVLGLSAADVAWPATQAAYAELLGQGADLRTIGPAQGSTLTTPAGAHPLLAPACTALAFYLFAAYVALERGLDPDHPPLLSKVTRTR
ncbi:SIS domain-containing protein [Deinococcus sp.]|uniref:SIS domain-containing protein n=1 Tax=Deinococcus sp. TaxID=47478 RepID=UPI0025C36158|nr:SIS domain-containing protein [Deinococcus sp.]